MNRNQLKRKRDKLSQDLREAKLRHNFVRQSEIIQELRKLDIREIELDREVRKITYADIAKQNMTDEEIRGFSATMIELAIISSLAEDVAMRAENYIYKWSQFDCDDIQRFKKAVSIFRSMLKPIDNVSKTHKTVDENGNPYTLNDHFGEMVDEMETYMLGMRNQIHKIVTQKVTIDGKDIQQFKQDCLQNGN